MQSLSTGVIVTLSITVALLFVNMVLSATSAADAYSNPSSSHKWSTWSAIISGLSLFVIAVSLGTYLYKDQIKAFL